MHGRIRVDGGYNGYNEGLDAQVLVKFYSRCLTISAYLSFYRLQFYLSTVLTCTVSKVK